MITDLTNRCVACGAPDHRPRAQVICSYCLNGPAPIPAKGKQGLWEYAP